MSITRLGFDFAFENFQRFPDERVILERRGRCRSRARRSIFRAGSGFGACTIESFLEAELQTPIAPADFLQDRFEKIAIARESRSIPSRSFVPAETRGGRCVLRARARFAESIQPLIKGRRTTDLIDGLLPERFEIDRFEFCSVGRSGCAGFVLRRPASRPRVARGRGCRRRGTASLISRRCGEAVTAVCLRRGVFPSRNADRFSITSFSVTWLSVWIALMTATSKCSFLFGAHFIRPSAPAN